MFYGPSAKRTVDAYYAVEFKTELEKDLLSVINESNIMVEVLNQYSKDIAKELAAKIAVDQKTFNSFKSMNLATKIHFLKVFYNLRSAAQEEASLRSRATYEFKIDDIDLSSLSENELYAYQSDREQAIRNREDNIHSLNRDISLIERELNPPSGGPSAPPAVESMEVSPYTYYLKMEMARSAVERENRRKELQQIQQMLRIAFQRNLEDLRQQQERLRASQKQLQVLEDRAPRRAYAYR